MATRAREKGRVLAGGDEVGELTVCVVEGERVLTRLRAWRAAEKSREEARAAAKAREEAAAKAREEAAAAEKALSYFQELCGSEKGREK
jgi:hypothetical protein